MNKAAPADQAAYDSKHPLNRAVSKERYSRGTPHSSRSGHAIDPPTEPGSSRLHLPHPPNSLRVFESWLGASQRPRLPLQAHFNEKTGPRLNKTPAVPKIMAQLGTAMLMNIPAKSAEFAYFCARPTDNHRFLPPKTVFATNQQPLCYAFNMIGSCSPLLDCACKSPKEHNYRQGDRHQILFGR